MIEFFVPGRAAPAGSKKGIRRGGHVAVIDANKKAAPWKERVALFASQVFSGSLMDGPIRASFVFCRLRPKNHHVANDRTRPVKNNQPIAPCGMPDVLKLSRGVEDALTGVIWTDDARIVVERLWKVYATVEGVCVRIEEQPIRSCPPWAEILLGDGEIT